MKNDRVSCSCLCELIHVVPQQPTLAALGRPCEEHQVTAVDVGRVDVLKAEHVTLDVLVKSLFGQEGPCKLVRCLFFSAVRFQVGC